jgi:hypothetical protein
MYLGDLYTKDELVEMYAEARRKFLVLQNRIIDIKKEVVKLQNDVFVGMIDKEEMFGACEEFLEMLDEKVEPLVKT